MTEIVVVVVAVWMLFGVVYAIGMGRRGYDPWSWGALGAIFGPLVIPLAIGLRRRRPLGAPLIAHAGRAGDGIKVLVGVDGSVESAAAVQAVVSLFGTRLGSLLLATVIDSDAANAIHAARGTVFERDANAIFEQATNRGGADDPTTLVLEGRPADALVACAKANDVDVVAVGRRGRGLSEAVLGSVAAQLARRKDGLLLVVGEHAALGAPVSEIGA
jgi:nucleotide-binding universal stress UspA family protein